MSVNTAVESSSQNSGVAVWVVSTCSARTVYAELTAMHITFISSWHQNDSKGSAELICHPRRPSFVKFWSLVLKAINLFLTGRGFFFLPKNYKANLYELMVLFWKQSFLLSVFLALVVILQDAFSLPEEAAACCLTSGQQAGLQQAHHSLHRQILCCVWSAFTQGEYLHWRSVSQCFKNLMFVMWNTN